MPAFESKGLPWNISFGAGAIRRVPVLLEQLGFRRPLLLSTPGRADQVALLSSALTAPPAGVYMNAAVHVPAACVEAAAAGARRLRPEMAEAVELVGFHNPVTLVDLAGRGARRRALGHDRASCHCA